MSRDCCVTLPRSAMGLSAFVVVVFPDHTEQNRTEILFGLKHYKLIVTTIHNIQNIYFTHAFKL